MVDERRHVLGPGQRAASERVTAFLNERVTTAERVDDRRVIERAVREAVGLAIASFVERARAVERAATVGGAVGELIGEADRERAAG